MAFPGFEEPTGNTARLIQHDQNTRSPLDCKRGSERKEACGKSETPRRHLKPAKRSHTGNSDKLSMNFSIPSSASALNSHHRSERKCRPPRRPDRVASHHRTKGITCVFLTKPSLGSRRAAQTGTLILIKRRYFLRQSVDQLNVFRTFVPKNKSIGSIAVPLTGLRWPP